MNQYKSIESKNSEKIVYDKYYTSEELALKLIKKTFDIIGKHNITEVLEPSAGNGAFSNQIEECIAIDISPENEAVMKADYLETNFPYKKGRLIIGNPPFGSRGVLFKKFFKKAIKEADYIAFILPSSQLHNVSSLWEFDLIHSVHLGNTKFSDRMVNCCFNIYRRPEGGLLNAKKKTRLKMVKICRQDAKKFNSFEYDIKLCYWGDGSAGKILQENESYSAMYKIKFDKDIKEEAIKVLTEVDWKERLTSVSMLKIQQFHILELLKEKIPNIQ